MVDQVALGYQIMAITIQQSFLKLQKNLEITDLQEVIVSTRQKNIRSVIEAGDWL